MKLRPLLLPKYCDYADIFKKKNAESLPPHRDYDCLIELQPEVKIPFGLIYGMSDPEVTTLREYLHENLAWDSSTSQPHHPVPRLCINYQAVNQITIIICYPSS